MNKMVNQITENAFNSDVFVEPEHNLITQEDDKPYFMLNVNPLNDINGDDDYSVMSSAYKFNPIPEAPSRSPDRSPNRSPNRSRSKLKRKASGMSVGSKRSIRKIGTREITNQTNTNTAASELNSVRDMKDDGIIA